MTRRDAECHRSPSGDHELVSGAITKYCKWCFIVPRGIFDIPDDELVTYPPAEEREKGKRRKVTIDGETFSLSKRQRFIQVVRAPTGTKYETILLDLVARDFPEKAPSCFFCEKELMDPRGMNWLPEAPGWPTIDHLLARAAGGTNDLDNLVIACRPCNTKKGSDVLLLADTIRRLRKERDALVNPELDGDAINLYVDGTDPDREVPREP